MKENKRMSQKVQRMSSTLVLGEKDAYLNWVKQKNEEQSRGNRLKIYENNRKMIEERIESEKRRVLNEICYWKWFEKKTKELKEKKLTEEEQRRKHEEIKLFEERNQAVKDMRFNEWLERKIMEENTKKQQNLLEKQEKDCENEMTKCEKEQAKIVWNLWLEKKEMEIKEEKLKKKEEEERKQKEMEEKQKKSKEEFKEWARKAAYRPKPTKSNQGFSSLSCSNIGYINPKPWKNILDDDPNNNKNDYDKLITVLYKKPSTNNFNNSTMKSYEEDNVIQRTANWVKHSTSRNSSEPKQMKLNGIKYNFKDYELLTMDEIMLLRRNRNGDHVSRIIQLDRRNKSAPVFSNCQRKGLVKESWK